MVESVQRPVEVIVTRPQVDAAKLIVARDQRKGRTTSFAIIKIANAQPKFPLETRNQAA